MRSMLSVTKSEEHAVRPRIAAERSMARYEHPRERGNHEVEQHRERHQRRAPLAVSIRSEPEDSAPTTPLTPRSHSWRAGAA